MEALALKFTIQSANGGHELCVDSESARVGSGSHCEIRLEPEHAAVEQLRVNVRAGGVFAEARTFEPPTLLNGAVFVQGRLLPDSVLKVGGVTIRVDVVERHALGGHRSGSAAASRRALYAIAGTGIPIAILLVGMGAGAASPSLDVPAQALWSGDEDFSCPEKEPSLAAARAGELSAHAESGRERSAFAPEDGVAAVELYAQAAACYTLASVNGRAQQARADETALRRELAARFHVHQVRLERALSTQRFEAAKLEVRTLLSFVHRRSDAYTDWLSMVDRQLVVKASE